VPGDKESYPETYEYSDATRTLRVGSGAFAPVAPEVYNFEVSGLRVVESWLGYRMREPKGKKSSPPDDIRPEKWTRDFTNELLELLWPGETADPRGQGPEDPPVATEEDESSEGSGCFTEEYLERELPPIPDWMRKPPRPSRPGLFDEG